jgi:sigma-B regulation protein RsbU (phosphoserine phosphatase)
VQLEPGDLLLLYTDGVSESQDEAGEQLGLDGLLAMARSLPTVSAMEAGQALVRAVAAFRGGAGASDDETVVVLERRAVAA